MKLTVIIPCFNAADAIAHQLAALANQQCSQPWELIVADNGSTDESLEIVERYRDRLTNLSVVDSSDRRGAAHARNVAARAASGEALIFCDADDEVAPGWLSAMGDALSIHDFVACRVDFAKLNPGWVQEIFRDHAQHHGLLKAWYPPYLAHAGAGTIGVKKSLHEAIGGFDESVRVQEDTDYCFRLQLAGVNLHFVPAALLHIRCRRSLPGLFRQASIWAEYTVFLYKRYRPLDSKDLWQRWRAFMRQSKNLLYSSPQLHSKAGRAEWVWKFGWQLGLLKASIKYQVPPV
jgi:glycosyltransferase involved in cell wall biosynthesis